MKKRDLPVELRTLFLMNDVSRQAEDTLLTAADRLEQLERENAELRAKVSTLEQGGWTIEKIQAALQGPWTSNPKQ